MPKEVLVLNANFEPIHVCNLRRAVGLVLNDRASLILNGRGEIRTVQRSFPRPSVIRLQKMIHRPRLHVRLTRREIFRRDNYTCQYCGKHTLALTVIVPKLVTLTRNWHIWCKSCGWLPHSWRFSVDITYFGTVTLTIDHVVPRHLGGPHTWTNIVAACSACNHRKGGRTMEEANMRLLSLPKEPPSSAYYIFGKHLTEYTEWEPFLTGW